MDFPDYGLVQLSPRDLVGPGVEFWARPIVNNPSGALIAIQTLPADQTSEERLYAIQWCFSAFPDPVAVPRQARWAVNFQSANVDIWGGHTPYSLGAAQRWDAKTPMLVIPGGHAMVFAIAFSVLGGGANGFEGWLSGYSFPKGNVLGY